MPLRCASVILTTVLPCASCRHTPHALALAPFLPPPPALGPAETMSRSVLSPMPRLGTLRTRRRAGVYDGFETSWRYESMSLTLRAADVCTRAIISSERGFAVTETEGKE